MMKKILLMIFCVSSVCVYPQTQSMMHSFSVSPNKSVVFSEGNLQYNSKRTEYKFAKNQYDVIGYSESQKYADWCDMFNWEQGNQCVVEGQESWRILTKKEWNYLLFERKNANMLLGFGFVNNVFGLVVLPDSYDNNNGFISMNDLKLQKNVSRYALIDDAHKKDNVYSKTSWKSIEKKGGVFLPLVSSSVIKEKNKEGLKGYYWSLDNDPTCLGRSFALSISSIDINATKSLPNELMCSVRLVKDIE